MLLPARLASTIAHAAIEDILSLLFILIEALLFLFILLTLEPPIRAARRRPRLHSLFLICLLALSIIALLSYPSHQVQALLDSFHHETTPLLPPPQGIPTAVPLQHERHGPTASHTRAGRIHLLPRHALWHLFPPSCRTHLSPIDLALPEPQRRCHRPRRLCILCQSHLLCQCYDLAQ